MPRIIAVTTVREGDSGDPVESTRAAASLNTAAQLAIHGMDCAAIHTQCSSKYLESLASLGVTLIEESRAGMGHARRQALRAGFDSGAEYIFWLEPEKPDMPRFATSLVQRMRESDAVLGLFLRQNLASYPTEQALYYTFCRVVATQLIGTDIDYGFGPMIVARRAVHYFLDYEGEYGDAWDSILIPRLRILAMNTVASIQINFANDRRMTEIESGRDAMMLKRVTQLSNIIPPLISEWRKLSVQYPHLLRTGPR